MKYNVATTFANNEVKMTIIEGTDLAAYGLISEGWIISQDLNGDDYDELLKKAKPIIDLWEAEFFEAELIKTEEEIIFTAFMTVKQEKVLIERNKESKSQISEEWMRTKITGKTRDEVIEKLENKNVFSGEWPAELIN